MSAIRGLQISRSAAGSGLTPEQRRFNTLVRQIDQVRQTLTAWRENIPLFRQTHVQVLLPLQTELDAARREWVFALDSLLGQPGWTRSERSTLRELVRNTAGELLDANGDDTALKALFDKHSEIGFDARKQHEIQAMKGMAEVLTGLDLGDGAEIRTNEELFARMHEAMKAEAAAAEAEPSTRPQRRKTAAQQRREAEAQLANQSMRDVYRKLASALHPDRESDPERRKAKTEWMQKVNQAYAANDLLALLEAQLQIEQVDAGRIAGASPARLKHYNKVLAEQLAGLKAELASTAAEFCFAFGMGPNAGINPHKLGALVDQQARLLRSELVRQQQELRMFADKPATKHWLKQQRHFLRAAALYDEFF